MLPEPAREFLFLVKLALHLAAGGDVQNGTLVAEHADGSGSLQPLATFMTNPAGSAIVNSTGPIRQIVNDPASSERRYLVVALGDATKFGEAVQVQTQ